MAWTIDYADTALRSLARIDRQAARDILDYMEKRIAVSPDPKVYGKPLTGSLKGRWRFRVRDYRVICSIKDDRLVILVIDIGHRKDVYES